MLGGASSIGVNLLTLGEKLSFLEQAHIVLEVYLLKRHFGLKSCKFVSPVEHIVALWRLLTRGAEAWRCR